jgi:hypothetical protein
MGNFPQHRAIRSLFEKITWLAKANGGNATDKSALQLNARRGREKLISAYFERAHCDIPTTEHYPYPNASQRFVEPNSNILWSYPATPLGVVRDYLVGALPSAKLALMTGDVLAAGEIGRICRQRALNRPPGGVSIRRWQNITARHAIWLDTGQPFNAIAQRPLTVPSEIADGR